MLVALFTGLFVALSSAPATATFPGKNGKILFIRGGDIYTATTAGASITRITTSGGIGGAKWSPDGKRIAYRRGSDLLVRTIATGKTVTVAVGADSAPQWSPDGTRIAFVAELPSAPCGEQGVFTVPSTGGGAPRLEYDPGSDNCPHGTDIFGLGSYLPGGQSIQLTDCYGWYDDDCWLEEVSMDPWAGTPPTARYISGISCTEEEAFPQDGSPATCSFGPVL